MHLLIVILFKYTRKENINIHESAKSLVENILTHNITKSSSQNDGGVSLQNLGVWVYPYIYKSFVLFT